jgi:hypothetical protein
MKKSNIIITGVVVISISWLVICGWLQANAYNIIKTGKTCSYAIISGEENKTPRNSFTHIKIEVAKIIQTPFLDIKFGKNHNISYSSSLKNALDSWVHNDTLHITVNTHTFGTYPYIKVFAPNLKSVTIKTVPDSTPKYKNSGLYTSISGFEGKTLSVFNTGQNNLRLYDNQFKKLSIRGNFYKGKEIEITNSSLCDSIDIDVEGQNGSLILGNSYFKTKDNSKIWASIKMPGSFRVATNAAIASKIILKK